MKILSIQVGMPKTIQYKGEPVHTGIFKYPIAGPVHLGALGLAGDGQADLKVHGGREKALYAFSADTYPNWKKLRPQDDFPYGALGENLSIDHLSEDKIFIGDTFQLGKAQVQVTQPRFPCSKLVAKFQDPSILKQFMKLNRPGVYFRVLQEGLVEAGDECKLIDQEKMRISVAELFTLDPQNTSDEKIHELLQVKAMPESWQKKFKSWL